MKINDGVTVGINIPKSTTAKNLVDVFSKELSIDQQKFSINPTRGNISLTSGDSGQVLKFAKGDIINVSVKQKWITLNFLFANKQQTSLMIEDGSSVE